MKRTHILIVEDEPWLGELYERLVETAGFSVTWERDGYAAMDQIDEHKPNLIVLDLLLPGANGVQLLHELASHADLESIPVIVWTNALTSLTLPQLRVYGVREIVNKTVKPQRFLAIVRKVLADAHVADQSHHLASR